MAGRRKSVARLVGLLLAGSLPWLGGCQSPAPQAGSNAQAPNPTPAPVATQQLGIDFRVPPTRPPAKPSGSPAANPSAVASPSPSATPR